MALILGRPSTGIEWPTAFGVPAREGYGVTVLPSFVSTEVEDGPARWRRSRTSPQYSVDVVFHFSPSAMLDFEAFVENDLNLGSEPFDMPLWFGAGAVTKVVHLAGEYRHAVVGLDTYQVAFTVDAWDLYTPPPPPDMIIAGTPAAPSADTIIAGTPAAPSTDRIFAPLLADL